MESRRYLEAVAIMTVALIVRLCLGTWLGAHTLFITAYPAIVVAAWRGGFGPALLSAGVAWVGTLVLIAAPAGQLSSPGTQVSFGVFAATATLSAALGGSLHGARARAEATATLLRSVFDHAPAILYVKDAHGNVLMSNRRYAELGGATDPEADAEALRGDRVETREEQVVLPAGRRTLLTTRVAMNEAGFPGRVLVGLATDVTEQRRSAEEVAHLQRLEVTGRLAGGVAHETNNQMTIVLGFAEMAARNPSLDPRTRAELGEIKAAATRVAHLTRQLLALGRQQVLRLDVLDLDEVVDDTLAVLDRLLGPDVQLQRIAHGGAKAAKVDRTQFVQILMNLVLNARDAMPSGGPLRIETSRADRAPDGCRLGRPFDGPVVVVSVTDSGTGIPPELLDRIFEPFFTTKGSREGTGLGLSVVEGIVAQTGGDLWVDSEVGRGTTFGVVLPLATAPVTALKAEEAPAQGAGRRLLLVEDDEGVRGALKRLLEDAGFAVLCAESSEEALQRVVEGGGFDLVVSDVAMPGMTGPELARRCASHAPELGFLFVSGHPAEALGEEPPPNQRGFLQKPFTPTTLSRAVDQALRQSPVSTGAARTPPPSVRSR